MSKPTIAFAGTPDFACYHLEQLIKAGYKPKLVLTQPDRQAGRGRKQHQTPVKRLAIKNNINVLQPLKIDDQTQLILQETNIDLLIVVAYGLILPDWMLNWPKFGAINVHASKLPRWRGAAPIQRAIEAMDSKTAVSIMQMEKGLDTGPIWSEKEVTIERDMNAQTLHDLLKQEGATLLINSLETIVQDKTKPIAQSSNGITYAKKLNKEEARINWQEDVETICAKINAFNPTPVAFFETGDKRFKVFKAKPSSITKKLNDADNIGQVIQETKDAIIVQAQNGTVSILELQEMGKKRLTSNVFLNGRSLLNLRLY